MHEVLVFALFRILQVFVIFFVHIRIRCWEGRVNVLRPDLVFSSLFSLQVVEVSLLDGSVFVQSATYEVGGVWQVNGIGTTTDCDALAVVSALAVSLDLRRSRHMAGAERTH